MRFENEEQIVASSIFEWYRDDFGGSEKEIINHLLIYAEPSLAEKLKGAKGISTTHTTGS